jgi:outer membrane protein TolC
LTVSASAASAAVTAETNALQVTPAFVNALAEEARTNNPALRAVAARAEATAANTATVPTWEDPMVRFGVMGAERPMRRDEGDLLYEVEQKIPMWGKPQAERRMAQAGAKIGEATVTLRVQQLKRDLAKAVFKAALADRTVGLDREDLRWLDVMQESTTRRYEVGDATQAEVLRVQNERSRRANQLETDVQLREQARVNLNRMLNRPLVSPWPELQLPPVAGPVRYNEQLVQFAVQYEPELKLRQEEIHEAEAAVDVSRRARLPDLVAGAEVRQYSGDGDFRQSMVTLGINLPWGNRKRYRAAVERDEARLRATRLDAADYELGLRNEVRALTVQIDAARREGLLYRDQIIPRSETALASTRAAWETGRGMFRDVLDARRMLVEVRLMEARAVTEQYEMLAELVLCCGLGDLEALQMISVLPDSENGGTKP